nr:alanine--tRNA ligase, mitochondrial isoform X3 [Ipomoea batatas]
MILMMLARTLITIPSLRCLVIGLSEIISKQRPFNGLGNFSQRYISCLVIGFMPLILGVMRSLVFQLTLRLKNSGSSFFPLNVFCLLVAKTTSGRWEILDLVDLAQRFTLIELETVMLHHSLIMMTLL